MKNIVCLAPKDNVLYNFRKEVMDAIKGAGYNVILVCPYGKKIEYFTDRGFEYIDININRHGTNPVQDIKLIHEYMKILKKVHADLVLTYTTKCSVYGGIACRLLGIPYIVNNSGLKIVDKDKKILNKILNSLYKVGYCKASLMMYQNEYEAKIINSILKNKVSYKIIPGSGVNIKEFKYVEYPKSNNEIIFNYVARVVDFKGIYELLKCAEIFKVKYDNIRFIIYGSFENHSYEKLVMEAVDKNIVEYGGVQLDMKPKIEIAHAVIHPSYYEGMTNVCLEHSAMGRPCIVSNVPGCKEIVENGKIGYVFEVKNVRDMEQQIEKFIKLPLDVKKSMGIYARKKIEKEFDRNSVVEIYLKEINKLLVNN